jgi:hypothetical protein
MLSFRTTEGELNVIACSIHGGRLNAYINVFGMLEEEKAICEL